MREHKYRAWDKDKLEMVYDSVEFAYRSLGENMPKTDGDAEHFIGWGKLNSLRFDMMQYTGLKTKSGVEIYEGDIVSQVGLTVPDIVGPVEWGSCYAASLGDVFTEMMGWIVRPKGYDPEPLFPFSGLEVIGNIYENKELLDES